METIQLALAGAVLPAVPRPTLTPRVPAQKAVGFLDLPVTDQTESEDSGVRRAAL